MSAELCGPERPAEQSASAGTLETLMALTLFQFAAGKLRAREAFWTGMFCALSSVALWSREWVTAAVFFCAVVAVGLWSNHQLRRAHFNAFAPLVRNQKDGASSEDDS